MRRSVVFVAVMVMFGLVLPGCFAAPQARQTAVVNVAVVTYPGGAPPQALSLYKAALEVNKAAAGEYELKLTEVSPSMADMTSMRMGQSSASSLPPTVAALEQAMGQDPPPEVVYFTSSYEFGAALQAGLLQDLDTYLRSDRNLNRDDYFPSALAAVSEGDRLYGLPVSVSPMVLQYDKRLFDAASLPPPDGSLDWAGLGNVSRALTKTTGDPQNDQWGINLWMSQWALPMFIWQNGGSIVSKDGRRSLLAEPEAVEAIEFYAEMLAETPNPNEARMGAGSIRAIEVRVGPGEAPPLMMPGGRVAMQFVSAQNVVSGYYYPGVAGSENPLRIAEVPHGKNKATMLEIQSVMGLTTRTSNGQAAFRALAALTAEMQKELPVPASRTAAKNLQQMSPSLDKKDVQVIVDSLEYAQAIPLVLQTRVSQVLSEHLMQPLMEGSKSPAEAAAKASEALDAALNE